MAGTVCGIFVNHDILDQLHTHLTGKLSRVRILLQTAHELLDIFLVLAALLLLGFQFGDYRIKLFLLGGVLLQQVDAHFFGNFSENLVLINLRNEVSKFIEPVLAIREALLIFGSLFCVFRLLLYKESGFCSGFVLNDLLTVLVIIFFLAGLLLPLLLDFGLLLGGINSDRYASLALTVEERWVILLPVDDPLAGRESLCSQDLTNRPLILPHSIDRQNLIRRWFGSKIPVSFVSCNLTANAAVMVRQGLGIAPVIEGSVPFDPSFIAARPLFPPVTTAVSLVWKKNDSLHPAAQVFLQHAKQLDDL